MFGLRVLEVCQAELWEKREDEARREETDAQQFQSSRGIGAFD
jgi:hypothetical protein